MGWKTSYLGIITVTTVLIALVTKANGRLYNHCSDISLLSSPQMMSRVSPKATVFVVSAPLYIVTVLYILFSNWPLLFSQVVQAAEPGGPELHCLWWLPYKAALIMTFEAVLKHVISRYQSDHRFYLLFLFVCLLIYIFFKYYILRKKKSEVTRRCYQSTTVSYQTSHTLS